MLLSTKQSERYLAKKQTLTSRREQSQNAIRDLGVLPEEAYNKYTDARADKVSFRLDVGCRRRKLTRQIMKKLHKVAASLKQYAHVNKKAFDQYQSFTKQRDEHLARRDELDKSAESIQELIETLDQRKDEAIERTFKQVSKYFEEVFEALVPAGKGELVMQKKIDGYMVS
jgi:structural maintenance of chromosome 3 (chondroitin sulfate proteoglycan 6)